MASGAIIEYFAGRLSSAADVQPGASNTHGGSVKNKLGIATILLAGAR